MPVPIKLAHYSEDTQISEIIHIWGGKKYILGAQKYWVWNMCLLDAPASQADEPFLSPSVEVETSAPQAAAWVPVRLCGLQANLASFHIHTRLGRQVAVSPFCRWGNWGSVRPRVSHQSYTAEKAKDPTHSQPFPTPHAPGEGEGGGGKNRQGSLEPSCCSPSRRPGSCLRESSGRGPRGNFGGGGRRCHDP